METTISIPNRSNIEQIFDFLDVSEATRRDYKYRISAFIEFINDNGFNCNSFLVYKRDLSGRCDYSVSTKNKYLGAARIFLKELHRQGLLPMDITHNVRSFKQDKKHKKDGINDEEMALILSKVKQLIDDRKTIRLKAILSLLTLQGLRQCEIVRLDFRDIDFVAGTALVWGKGRDDKEVICLHPESIQSLKRFVKGCGVADGPLFASWSNNGRNKRMSTRALRGIVKGFLEELGIEKSVHGFRHYFTTKLVRSYKGDLLQVAKYTRHLGLEMLMVYNDDIKDKDDLPRYYEAFNSITF